jgi:hypothetical protein
MPVGASHADHAEADLARDTDMDVNTYGMVCDRLRRIIESLGIERKAREAAGALQGAKSPPKPIPR